MYPVHIQVCRVTGTTVPGPSGTSSSVSLGGISLYVAFTQQLRSDDLTYRDREPCLVFEVDGAVLTEGRYVCRLVGSYSNLPLYATTSVPDTANTYRLGLTLTPITAISGSLLGKGTVLYYTEEIDNLGNRSLIPTNESGTVYNECAEIAVGWFVDTFRNPPLMTPYARARCAFVDLDLGGPPDVSIVTPCCPDGLPKKTKLCWQLPEFWPPCAGYTKLEIDGFYTDEIIDGGFPPGWNFEYLDSYVSINLRLACEGVTDGVPAWTIYGGYSLYNQIDIECAPSVWGGNPPAVWNSIINLTPGTAPAVQTLVSYSCDPFSVVIEQFASTLLHTIFTFSGDDACDDADLCDVTVSFEDASIYVNAPTISITGTGFSTVPANNAIALNLSAVAHCISSSSTVAVFQFDTPPSGTGALTATITVANCTSGSPVQVGTVVCANVIVNTNYSLVDATTIVIRGNGFSTTAANNTVVFNLGADGTVTAATATELTVTFGTPPTAGDLTVIVTNTDNSCTSGDPVQVGTVVEEYPADACSTDSVTSDVNTTLENNASGSGYGVQWVKWPTTTGMCGRIARAATTLSAGASISTEIYKGSCPDDLTFLGSFDGNGCFDLVNSVTETGFIFVKMVFNLGSSGSIVGWHRFDTGLQCDGEACVAASGGTCAEAITLTDGVESAPVVVGGASETWFKFASTNSVSHMMHGITADTGVTFTFYGGTCDSLGSPLFSWGGDDCFVTGTLPTGFTLIKVETTGAATFSVLTEVGGSC